MKAGGPKANVLMCCGALERARPRLPRQPSSLCSLSSPRCSRVRLVHFSGLFSRSNATSVSFASSSAGSSLNSKDIALQSLSLLLASAPVRQLVWSLEDSPTPILSILIKIIKATSSPPQILYQTGFCLWEVTFDKEVSEGLDR